MESSSNKEEMLKSENMGGSLGGSLAVAEYRGWLDVRMVRGIGPGSWDQSLNEFIPCRGKWVVSLGRVDILWFVGAFYTGYPLYCPSFLGLGFIPCLPRSLILAIFPSCLYCHRRALHNDLCIPKTFQMIPYIAL